jgi:hypothetical protein
MRQAFRDIEAGFIPAQHALDRERVPQRMQTGSACSLSWPKAQAATGLGEPRQYSFLLDGVAFRRQEERGDRGVGVVLVAHLEIATELGDRGGMQRHPPRFGELAWRNQ